MKKFTVFFISALFIIFLLFTVLKIFSSKKYWEVQSIDTMKYSRDLAREMLNKQNADVVIDKQMQNIAATHANYVAIGTPYDEEFSPVLKQWVTAARKYKLHVWFRGNFSGWEEWFGYPKMTSTEHIIKTQEFIKTNKDLFQNGDIFTSCPECENGMKVAYNDPKSVERFRKFLIAEYHVTNNTFSYIGKTVKSNYYSMNEDLARVLMDQQTTKTLDGTVVIDHYVANPDKFVDDIKYLAKYSGGKIVVGEFGAPIPDIQGTMSDSEQAAWINDVLQKLAQIPEVTGVNYWVNTGGSTAIWTTEGRAKPAVSIIQKYYSQGKSF